MPEISSFLRLMVWIVTGMATISLTILTVVLQSNLAFIVRILIPQLRKRGGGQPTKKPLVVWMFFWFSASIVILGTAVASSAPEAEVHSATDSQDVDIASLFPNLDISSYKTDVRYVNMDGFGSNEIIVYGEKNSSGNFIDVFSFDASNEWRRVLHVTKVGSCGIGFSCCGLEFDFLNLYKNTSRQLLVYQQCGSGSFLSLQVYQYRGLSFAESVFETKDPIYQGVVSVVNEELYVTSYIGEQFFHLLSTNSVVSMETLSIDLPDNIHKVHYWRGETSIIFSGNLQDVQIGDFILFIHDRDKDVTSCAGDLRLDSEYLAFTEYPNMFTTLKSGKTYIVLACRMGMFSSSLEFEIQ